MENKLLIVLPISRLWCLERLIGYIKKLAIPEELGKPDLLVMTDSDKPEFIRQVHFFLNDLGDLNKFSSIFGAVTALPKIPDSAHVVAKRQRIIEIWELMQDYVKDYDYVFGIEDDTVFPNDALTKLYKDMNEYQASYAEGVQRHRQCDSVGVWRIDRTFIMTLKNRKEGISDIDGGGFYCFLTRGKYLGEAKFRQDGPPFGPDVCYVYDLVKKKKKAIVDWSVQCGHRLDDRVTIYPESGVIRYIKNNKEWEVDNETGSKQS